MVNHHGDFIWYELITPDPAAAEAFYGPVIGWTIHDCEMPGQEYRLATMGGTDVAGIMGLTDEMKAGGARPVWLGYIGVDDVDAAVATIGAAGGKVLMPPQDIPEVGRFAFLTDPNGAPFYVMRGLSDEPSQAFAQDGPRDGHCAWNELRSGDPVAAAAFYGTCFGWEKADSMDMGPMGSYDMFRNPPHAALLGAIMPEMGAPGWAYYFRVPDIDAAAARIAEGGGKLIMDPEPIPGGEFMLNAIDPQGAMFALVGKRAA